MNRISKLFFLSAFSFFFFIYSMNAQVELGSLIKDKWIALAEQAVEESFVQVRVEYVLQEVKTGYQYGRGKLEYFNRIYSTGVLVNNQLWIDQKTYNTPWKDDPLFSGYREDENYKPVVSNVSILGINDTEYSSQEVSLKDSVAGDGWIWVGLSHAMEANTSNLLVMDKDQEMENYALVVVLKSSDVEDDEVANLKLEIRLKELRDPIEDNKINSSIDNTNGNSGALLTPIAKDGAIVFKVYGLIHNLTKGQTWNITRLENKESTDTNPTLQRLDGENPEQKKSELLDEYTDETVDVDQLTPKNDENNEGTNTDETPKKKKKKKRGFFKKRSNN